MNNKTFAQNCFLIQNFHTNFRKFISFLDKFVFDETMIPNKDPSLESGTQQRKPDKMY